MQVCYDGDFLPADQPIITASSPVFKWGDGLFETARMWQGKLLLTALHFERLNKSMQLLEMKAETEWTEKIERNIYRLCAENKCSESARVRLAVFRSTDHTVSYVIEAIPLHESTFQWKKEGAELVLYLDARKAVDKFSNIKSANYQPYRLAAGFARNAGADDALVLNTDGAICDSSRANIFLVKDGLLLTPALNQGCIGGVMRQVVMKQARAIGYIVSEGVVTEQDLLQADEVFLTNAIQVIHWVKRFRTATYTHQHTKLIFDAVSSTITG